MRVRDAVVVVATGASGGIGRATAEAFAKRGAIVVLAARRPRALEEAARACRTRGAEALVVPTDVSDAGAVTELARRTVERFGRLDVWVNAAAVTTFGFLDRLPAEDVQRVLDVDLLGSVHGARAALPQMRKQGRGVLINVASVLAGVPQAYAAPYCMAKAGVRAMGSSLRQELLLAGARDVRVCTVLPAVVDTPLWGQAGNHTGRRARILPVVNTPQRVARRIVNLVRVPRWEAPVGAMARPLLWQARLAPGSTERSMAYFTDLTMFSPQPEPHHSGNLHEPWGDPSRVDGGWHGCRRTATRRIGALAALAAAFAWGRSRR